MPANVVNVPLLSHSLRVMQNIVTGKPWQVLIVCLGNSVRAHSVMYSVQPYGMFEYF